MLHFCSLYSGSTGNSLLVKTASTTVLVDVGVSTKKIVEALTSINVSITDIDAILITHEHTDHVKSLGMISKAYHIPVYANIETWSAMPEQKNKVEIENQKIFQVSERFDIGDIEVFPFSIPHDAANPCGFNLFQGDQKISIATDLGHITPDIMAHLENSSFIMLESNYDPNVLQCGHYPYMLKSRIAGPNGHLSNELAGKTISHLIPTGLKSVMLGHLSKENNFPELAYHTVLEELTASHFNTDCIQLSVASRAEPSALLAIG